MKRYEEFVNEDITKFMVPKSKDVILKRLEGLSDNEKIEKIIKYQLDFDLLPRDKNGICSYKGSLFCSSCGLTELPDNLTVSGTLYCRDNNLTKLPDNLNVGSGLFCSGNKLTKLPDNLSVGSYLDCSENKVELTLPPTAKVGGTFYN